ncbi:hypothetical protein NHX12_015551 [Muraenolepis orangiensis]|uniref:NACHT domain-containing protein n=2 Tax=Muraenolepis orangiensis TaxID=630683 RepID=A0A9Q0DA83_9TELE|nr:hypothetical protein NHX12_015551 [Muraenolepis orangiensis]
MEKDFQSAPKRFWQTIRRLMRRKRGSIQAVYIECQHNIKSHLMQKFRRVFEGIAKAGQQTDLNDFYTELFITERVSGEVNKDHEVRQIETASRKPAKEETPIKCEDIFKPLPGQDQPSRTIMTTGVAGIGKTVLTHKFTLDWAEGKANHDIHFMFPFTFRELNLLKEKEFSLVELIHHFFIQTKGILRYDRFQVVFILDGLDECRLPLDFQNNPIWTDVTKSTSVDVLLTNLIRGDLLPSARIWITTRPAAANQIPAECVDMVTEVRGFTDPQKEEYFKKRFREETLASTIISHIKTSRSLHIMCHIPKFRRVFEGIAKEGQPTGLNDFFTELFITERVSGEVNKEHEVRLIETASRKPAKEETPIKCEDIFKSLPGQDQPGRTIMTTGVAGIGKTVLTYKFSLWTGLKVKANHDIHFMFPFTFRELNLLKNKEFSLMELLHHFFIETKESADMTCSKLSSSWMVLDECRLPLDFQNNPIWNDVTKSTSVDVLLTNLIRGDLFPPLASG